MIENKVEGEPMMADSINQEEAIILKEIAELLNEGMDELKILAGVLKKLLHVTGFQIGWIFLIDEDGHHQFAASDSLPPALSAHNCIRMKERNCWCVNRYVNGKLDKATNIIQCQRIESALRDQSGDNQGLTHHATIPLRAGSERFGLLNVGSPYKTHFHQDELALLESIAYQIGTALKRIRLTQKEQEIALVAERNRLARDLHDSVSQLLFSLRLTARAGMEISNNHEVKETFQYIQELSQEALGEMRALIKQLRPQGLENGIISALSDYANILGLTLHPKITGVMHFPERIEEALWRIGQEALANCKKHAQTDNVHLEMNADHQHITMTIYDDGCGFFYDENGKIPSFGIKNMKARTKELGGTFTLQSSPGNGTAIHIRMPI